MSAPTPSTTALDNPAWSALNGPHGHLAEVFGSARRYPVEVSLFAGIDDLEDAQAWRDLKELVGPEGTPVLIRRELKVPSGWETIFSGSGVQMLGDRVEGEIDPTAVNLSDDDIPQMLDLIARTEPGPFAARTIELGGYIGIKKNGQLIAMAGRRMNPVGWCEISAVCTDPDFRSRGLASRLVRTLVANIKTSGDSPFLHASATNVNAIRLYQSMGFILRAEMNFGVFKVLQLNASQDTI